MNAADVQEHLQSGETFRAAVWVSRAAGHSAEMSRAEMSPWRFRRPPAARRDAPSSLATALEEHLDTVNDPRVLALTDRRLLVLAKRSGLFRRGSGPLRLRWECLRSSLTSATEQNGRLRLTFTDRSTATVLTPTAQVQPFLDVLAP
ncbi:hypothetical protein AB0J66_03285 [Actinoplanes sp. NPDC049598]|uniref:hypothetical protein n=1 Tax=Actinoplanes sp. NPDC049598 TaxID=3154626 RepID=UPI003424AE40